MKKLAIVVCIFAAVSAFAAPSLDWYSQSYQDVLDGLTPTWMDIYNPSGTLVLVTDNWYTSLYRTDTMAEIYGSNQAITIDGVLLDNNAPDVASYNGVSVQARIYNASTMGAATMYADTSLGTTLTWDAGNPPPQSLNYNVGTVSKDSWQAVPEPVTAMIAFLGVPVAVLVRRRMNK